RWNKGRLAALAGTAVLGCLLFLGLRSWLSRRPAEPADPVAAQLQAFGKRWAAGENGEKLFAEVAAFQGKHAGQVPVVLEAARLLRQLPSPLDQLSPTRIPDVERYDWQPRDQLVALLGAQRFRMWDTAPTALAWGPARGWVA